MENFGQLFHQDLATEQYTRDVKGETESTDYRP